MEMALDISDREKQFDTLKKDDEIKTLQLQKTRMIITSIVLAVVVLIAIFNLAFGRRKNN